MNTRPYEKLIAWKESHILCLQIYTVTREFPMEEKFSLTNQMRRSSSSIPTNIAEGNVRRGPKDKAKFFLIALGSLEELHYQCRLCKDLGYITEDVYNTLDKQIHRTSFLLTKLRSAFSP